MVVLVVCAVGDSLSVRCVIVSEFKMIALIVMVMMVMMVSVVSIIFSIVIVINLSCQHLLAARSHRLADKDGLNKRRSFMPTVMYSQILLQAA